MSVYKMKAEDLRKLDNEVLLRYLRQLEIEIKRLDGMRGIGVLTTINPYKKNKIHYDLHEARRYKELKKNRARLKGILGERGVKV